MSGDFEVVVWAVGSWGMAIFSWWMSYRNLLWVCEERGILNDYKLIMYIIVILLVVFDAVCK